MNGQRLRRIGSTQLRTGVVVVGCIQLAFASGCRKEEIHSYRVPKEVQARTPEVAQSQQSLPDGEVMWTLPSSWNEVETTSSMRIATFQTPQDVDVAVTAFPGDVGGLVANVNRWRGQVGVDQTDEQGVEENIERLPGTNVIVVDISGESTRLIGSIINVGDGQTWFAKAMGDSESVGQLKSDLVAFSKTFHIHSENETHQPQQTQETDQVPQTQAVPPSATDAGSWEQPSEWKADPKASSILMAAYFADSGARITLTSLGGQGGGLLSNINRWRGQLAMPPIASMEEQPVKDLGNGSLIVDLVSEDGNGRIVAGIVPNGSQTLFFKMTGSVAETDSEMDRFETFVTGFGTGRTGEP
jgi:hypothetical protein